MRSAQMALITVMVLAGPAGFSLAEAPRVLAEPWARTTIYHSPQTPGYTCWVGAWRMSDGSLMVAFTQATGPRNGRPRAAEMLRKMGLNAEDPGRDFTGLRLANIYLRSTDHGATWSKTAEVAFTGPLDRPVWGPSHVGLAGGGILRAVDGSQQPLLPDVPRRIYFQRSSDSGQSWGLPELPPAPTRPLDDFVGDYGDCITRVRRLRDGQLMATGVSRPAGPLPRRRGAGVESGEPVVLLSPDEGRTWHVQAIELPEDASGPGVWNEWDSAELPTGDFLCVFRRRDPEDRSRQVRWQGLLRDRGSKWRLENYQPAPFEHSGHPELLATAEGLVLHIATTGIHGTSDGGHTWFAVEAPEGQKPYRSAYYPRSLQTENGQIFIFAHTGGDDAYGRRDQAIVLDTIRLSR